MTTPATSDGAADTAFKIAARAAVASRDWAGVALAYTRYGAVLELLGEATRLGRIETFEISRSTRGNATTDQEHQP